MVSERAMIRVRTGVRASVSEKQWWARGIVIGRTMIEVSVIVNETPNRWDRNSFSEHCLGFMWFLPPECIYDCATEEDWSNCRKTSGMAKFSVNFVFLFRHSLQFFAVMSVKIIFGTKGFRCFFDTSILVYSFWGVKVSHLSVPGLTLNVKIKSRKFEMKTKITTFLSLMQLFWKRL